VAHAAAGFRRGDVVADRRVVLQKADPQRAAFVRRAQARRIRVSFLFSSVLVTHERDAIGSTVRAGGGGEWAAEEEDGHRRFMLIVRAIRTTQRAR
jgi:hypothetical protein